MEFELDGSNFEASGNVELTLPDFMIMLQREELVEARRSSQRDVMIVAAGRNPSTGEIVLMTATNRLLTLNPIEHGIPDGPVTPIDSGHGIVVENNGYFEIASDWVISIAKPIDVTFTS